jgi:hypothetical protein
MKTIFALLSLVGLIVAGCGPQTRRVEATSRMTQLFTTDFQDFKAPDASLITAGESRAFENAAYDDVWDATVVVLMQDGAIVRSSKAAGVLVALTRPPRAVYVEPARAGKIRVYTYGMRELYTAVDEPRTALVTSFPQGNEGDFFDRVSGQLYAGQKWKYLYVGE